MNGNDIQQKATYLVDALALIYLVDLPYEYQVIARMLVKNDEGHRNNADFTDDEDCLNLGLDTLFDTDSVLFCKSLQFIPKAQLILCMLNRGYFNVDER